jgi:hypothetical protein
MRHDPKNSSRKSRPTPATGVNPTRAGIHGLDCGDDMMASDTEIIRRAAPEAPPISMPPAADPIRERRQSG